MDFKLIQYMMTLLYHQLMENTNIFWVEVGFHLVIVLTYKQDMGLDLILCNMLESDTFVQKIHMPIKFQSSTNKRPDNKFQKIT